MCWSALFGFFPIIWTVLAEFSAVAFEAGICQYLALMMLPIINFAKQLLGIVTAAPAPPALAPPAPPPPPNSPSLVEVVSVATFTFAEEHPAAYLLIDFLTAFAVALFFLFLKDINEWNEKRQMAERKAAEKAEKKVSACGKTGRPPFTAAIFISADVAHPSALRRSHHRCHAHACCDAHHHTSVESQTSGKARGDHFGYEELPDEADVEMGGGNGDGSEEGEEEDKTSAEALNKELRETIDRVRPPQRAQ